MVIELKGISRFATNDVFLKMLIMNNKEISHFVRNDSVSSGLEEENWRLRRQFSSLHDSCELSFRPTGEISFTLFMLSDSYWIQLMLIFNRLQFFGKQADMKTLNFERTSEKLADML